VIAEEAGGLVTGSHQDFTSATDELGVVTEEILTGRKYLVVRAIADTKVWQRQSITGEKLIATYRTKRGKRRRGALSRSFTTP